MSINRFNKSTSKEVYLVTLQEKIDFTFLIVLSIRLQSYEFIWYSGPQLPGRRLAPVRGLIGTGLHNAVLFII